MQHSSFVSAEMRGITGCLLLALICAVAQGTQDTAHAAGFVVRRVVLDCGENIGPHVAARLHTLLASVVPLEQFDQVSGKDVYG